jgi:hypothetical protein
MQNPQPSFLWPIYQDVQVAVAIQRHYLAAQPTFLLRPLDAYSIADLKPLAHVCPHS